MSTSVIVRAVNKEGYHKDIAILDADQHRMTEVRVKQDMSVALTPGVCVAIAPADFPEMVRFEVIVRKDR